MKFNTRVYFMCVLVIIFIITTCRSSSLPEDYVTDNEEQLARLKRGNFLDSILKHLPFFGNKNVKHDEVTKAEIEEAKLDKSAENPEEKIVPLMSSIASSSSYESYEINSIKLSSLINITRTSLIANHTFSSTHSSIDSLYHTDTLNQSHIFTPKISNSSAVSIYSSSSTMLLSSSLILKDSISPSRKTDTMSVLNFPVTSVMYSTTAWPSPSKPATHITSSVLDTAPLTSIPLRTDFSSSTELLSSSFHKTEEISFRVSSVAKDNDYDAQPTPVKKDEKQMPALPDESGSSDKDFKLPAVENEKEVSFVYLNILLPIVSGITGALLITFSIMLFRCCRRRKLKKVRYFGGKPSSDFVRLDKMNLLTDTSDEDDFD